MSAGAIGSALVPYWLDADRARARVNELHVRWEAIPPDVREILCWPPVLERYLDLARECPEWRPSHEYESLERAWQLRLPGLARAGLQRAALAFLDHATPTIGDASASSMADSNVTDAAEPAPYPWSSTALDAAGVPADDRARLVAEGWLVRPLVGGGLAGASRPLAELAGGIGPRRALGVGRR